jgi:outer membrane protein assembly factor BamB
MNRFLAGSRSFAGRAALFALILLISSRVYVLAQNSPSADSHSYFIDCSSPVAGEGSRAHPWNSLSSAEAHAFLPGDQIALARGSVCKGSLSPQGSGTANQPIRLTAYGKGPRPRIVAPGSTRQALLLFNQEYWQIDSLDISGGNTYGVFVTADRGGVLHHLYLKNLYVHGVYGGELKHKDNGIVVIGPSKLGAIFEDVLVDGVVAAHTNQWAGILVGGGPFYTPDETPLNRNVVIRNSSVQDVYGDGIILFRDANSRIETSTAFETGMQPTQSVGTPNAIWTWTCTDCTVQDNEAFLTDSPGVDGGAYDIDWDNTRNIVQRNYAHDTQGYCVAVFAAGYTTRDSIVRDNLCIDNGLSPRLAAMQGAVYIATWNDGVIHNLRIENNKIIWNPTVASASAIVNPGTVDGPGTVFTGNVVESSAMSFYRNNEKFAPSGNTYLYSGVGEAQFTLGDHKDTSLSELQAAGFEKGSTLAQQVRTAQKTALLKLDATIAFALDSDGLLAPEPRAQLMVMRSLAAQYGPDSLAGTVHLVGDAGSPAERDAMANALLDLDATAIHFDHDGQAQGLIRLADSDGRKLEEWNGFQNASTLGGAVRERLGAPHYSRMSLSGTTEAKH